MIVDEYAIILRILIELMKLSEHYLYSWDSNRLMVKDRDILMEISKHVVLIMNELIYNDESIYF